MASASVIKIECHVDILCPWCYLQKRALEVAIEEFLERYRGWRFEVIWKPFYLNPQLGIGLDKRELYEEKFPQFPAAKARIRAAATQRGILFSLTGRTGSSRSAHILSALALERVGPIAQAFVVEQLFSGHFEHGRDISDEEWLAEVGRRAGLAEDDVRAVLRGEEAGAAVDREVEAAKSGGDVGAVPCVTVQGRYRVGGYQEPAVFKAVFQKITAAKENTQ